MAGTLQDQLRLYTDAGVTFITAFFPKDAYAEEYKNLHNDLHVDPLVQTRLESMYTMLLDELLQPSRIAGLIKTHSNLARRFFMQFREIALGDTAQVQGVSEELNRDIDAACPKSGDRLILKSFIKFNESILMTNFFKAGIGADDAISFRLNPKVVFQGRPKSQYPEVPYGIYLIQGRDFCGFHTRMRDVARGGLRLIISRDQAAYDRNARSLFDEGYNLALTQQRKNKDIPEGGSKGVMLPHLGVDGKATFTRYVNALLDCMMPEKTGIYAGNMQGNPEMLFFGPDENTADFMDHGALLAKNRGYRLWKALTTGKSVKLGGVPHDTYGMTTAGVHRFVVELLEALNVDESTITKCQTGGPDGDLGSNEVLCSKDKTLSIVDGSGVVYDPAGLNRTELVRLATLRVPVKNFNRSLLGAGAFLVTVDDKDVTLPDGSTWQNGAQLRDTFHLTDYFTADLFVPCGGRPKAINLENVQKMFDPRTSKPKFRFIIEGANLFFTDQARAVLERAGVHLFKDASTNKGGVCSSSQEVLAGLAFADKEHSSLMTYDKDTGGAASSFYNQYVQDILGIIHQNARLEFHALWDANRSRGISKLEATRLLSLEITEMQDVLSENANGMDPDEKLDLLWTVLPRAVPQCLVRHLGVQGILDSVPENYLWAIVGSWIGSRYVYEHGIGASKVSFFFFMRRLSCIAKISKQMRKWLVNLRAAGKLRSTTPSDACSEPLREPSPGRVVPAPPKEANSRPRPGGQYKSSPEPVKYSMSPDAFYQGSARKAAAGLRQNGNAACLLGPQGKEDTPKEKTARQNAYAAKGNRSMRTSMAAGMVA